MASTNRTDHYNLNNWSGTDKPTRSDFVRDNFLIDTALWMHTSDAGSHLSLTEKSRVSDPYVVSVYQGTDEATRNFDFDFTPKLVLYFPIDEPLSYHDNGTQWIFYAIAAANAGSSAACGISTNRFTVHNTTIGNMNWELNNSSYQYVLVAFR